MKAMILAAGKGTRLAPLTQLTPKPLLTLAGRPLIEWQVQALAQAGVDEIMINLHHLGGQISNYLGNGEKYDLKITYCHEIELLETGGGIVNALPFLGDQPFYLFNGDIWTDFNFQKLPARPRQDNLAHLVITPTPKNRPTGDFQFTNGQITGRGNDYVYCGIALLNPALFSGQSKRHFSLRDLYFDLISQGRLGAQTHQGRWHDIGTLQEYTLLQREVKAPS